MMGERLTGQEALFYGFSLEQHVPADHLLRSIDRFVDLSGVREHLRDYYSSTGRPSVDPELMIRMLIVGYCFGIRSERRLCEEVHLNLAYRWFCRLGLERGVPGAEGHGSLSPSRAVGEYIEVLDDAAFGGATKVTPKFLSPADPATRWTGAHGGQAFFAYSTNYLIDLDHAVIVDVEASTAIRQAEVKATKTMIERTAQSFELEPARLAADTAYGSAEMLSWLVHDRGIEPHIPVFDKSARRDGTFSRDDFRYDHDNDVYICPEGKTLHTKGTLVNDGATLLYRASKRDCDPCPMKSRCCPKGPARKVPRSIYEGARDMARDIANTDAYVVSRRQRKKVEMLFAHLKRILKLDRLRLRGPTGARDEFLLAATAQNLRKLAKLIPMAQLKPAN